ncbi:MAG TPA: DUF3788 family protein [Leptolinea sp.]
MNERPFLEKLNKPTEQTMRLALGSMFIYYKEIIELASSYSYEWMHSRSGGWMLKISDRKKALFYLIPLKEWFKISMAVREEERKLLLSDAELSEMHEKIALAKKYAEGFALQFDIANQNDFQLVELFIKKLIGMRV